MAIVRAPSSHDGEDFETKTPVGQSPDEVLAFRVSRTISSGTFELRQEMKQDIRDQNKKIESLSNDVGAVKGDVREMKGQLGTLVSLVEKQTDLVAKQLDASNERQELKLTATLDVGKQAALVPVEDAKARRENWRTIVLAIFGGGGAMFILLKLLTGCSG